MSDAYEIKIGAPIYTNWTIARAVKDGYKACPSVFRAVHLITKAASSVPWMVYDDGEEVPNHHLTKLMASPNPKISRQDLFELVVSWIELAGNAYLKQVILGGKTEELWPISPDRIAPIPSKSVDEWIYGYSLDNSRRVDFKPEEIIHFKLFNPANPILGISPLEAVAKIVDVDVDQLDWNKAAMQNRCVIDGLLSFERTFPNQADADAVAEKLNERYAGKGNARRLGVIGGKAQYIRTALTPVEMDFANSRKDHREEIYITFGVPPQYAGVQESSTYNNYQTSEIIFWVSTIIPLLDDISETLNFRFKKELKPAEWLGYDISKVPAMRRALDDRSKTARTLFEMGVPFDQVNRLFEFGVQEYPGWDMSYVKGNAPPVDAGVGARGGVPRVTIASRPTLMERRGYNQKEADEKEDTASKIIKPKILGLLEVQGERVSGVLMDKGPDLAAVLRALGSDRDEWIETLSGIYVDVGGLFGSRVVVEGRAISQELEDAIRAEMDILKEYTELSDGTVDQISKQIKQGLEEGWSIDQIQTAINDCGIFDAERALRIARTITGSAASLGQWESGKLAGAVKKKWLTAGFEVRPAHQARSNEIVAINERYSRQISNQGPMYPSDPVLSAADRINCRCSQNFLKE
jgi:HK97 family phage portal protein